MTDDIPGDYDSTDGILARTRALGADDVADILEDTRDRVKSDGNGYTLENPPDDARDEVWFAQLCVLFGAALEREKPAVVDDE